MTLREQLAELRKKINDERDRRERDGWLGEPKQSDRPDPAYYYPRVERNMVHRPSKIYS